MENTINASSINLTLELMKQNGIELTKSVSDLTAAVNALINILSSNILES